jgi:hypothetical protein
VETVIRPVSPFTALPVLTLMLPLDPVASADETSTLPPTVLPEPARSDTLPPSDADEDPAVKLILPALPSSDAPAATPTEPPVAS